MQTPARPLTFPPPVLILAAVVLQALALFASSGRAAAPVLVFRDGGSTNPFGAYYSEILRGEGLMAFQEQNLSTWSQSPDPAAYLASFRAIVLPETNLNPVQRKFLRSYVNAGGILVGARPDEGLADVFGIEWAGNRPENLLQYYGVDAVVAPGKGITQGPLQFHGVASNYILKGATGLAHLYANPTTASSYAAATTYNYGQGKAIAFAFDPAKSVVLTRQGNPAWQNTEGDGIAEYRPHDLFARSGARTYYDPTRMQIPHADELQRFVANVITEAVGAPLPRMWYLPDGQKTLMINTGDGEDNFGAQFDPILQDAASYGGKFSVYLRDYGVANTTALKESHWRADSHEVGVHAYADGLDGAGAEAYMDFAYGRVVGALQSKFGHGARTARSHSIDWTGWVDMARIEANHGTQLDTNYYHYLNGAVVNPLTANGYFTGSGLPQRFLDEDGQLLNIYQAATQWPDEWFANNGLTAQQTLNIITTMFETAEAQGYYSAFVNNIHPVRYYGADLITSAWANAVWQYCEGNDIPMWSAEMLLDFTLARNESKFLNVAYSPGLLNFDFEAGEAGFDLTLMIPRSWGEQRLQQILVDGAPVEFLFETIKGVDYAMFTTSVAQAHIAASYTLPPAADFNGDGVVDGADLAQWREQFSSGPTSDADDDGDSDGSDFLLWQRQLTSRLIADASLGVPEPASTTLALMTMAVTAVTTRFCPRRSCLSAVRWMPLS